jgi:hypothetical protein
VRRVGGDRQAGPLGRRVFFGDVGGLLERRHPAPAGVDRNDATRRTTRG